METGSPDGLDARIEALLRDWHHSPDLLFSIHPVDGSFLIWCALSFNYCYFKLKTICFIKGCRVAGRISSRII